MGNEAIFVMEDFFVDATPKENAWAMDMIAVHEHGEAVLGNHHDASLLEFAIAEEEGKTEAYLEFLDKRAKNKMVDVVMNRMGQVFKEELNRLGMKVADGFEQNLN